MTLERPRPSRRLYALVFALMGGAFLFVGGYIALIAGPHADREARRIEALPAASPDSRIPTEVALTGVLTHNVPSDDNAYGAADLQLIAYEVHEWRVRTTSDGGVSGVWILKRRVWTTPLALQVGDDYYLDHTWIAASTTATWGGALHETLARDGDGLRTAAYNGTELHDGAVRVRGFRNGDVATVVGVMRNDVVPERLYGGTRAELVADLRGDAQFMRGFGLCFGGAGAALSAVALAFVRRR